MSVQDAHTPLQKEIDRRVRQRVFDGIELLKNKWGDDWVDHIDLREFDLTSGSCCVLGQLYHGSYGDGLSLLGIVGEGGRYGFDATPGIDGYEAEELYRDFETIWRQQIAELQGSRREEVSPV